MKREARLRGRAAGVPLEEMEARTLLSAAPVYIYHPPKLQRPTALQAKLNSLITQGSGGAYTYTLPGGNVVEAIGPEQVATFYSTAAMGNITVSIDWGDGSSSAGTVVKLNGHAGNAKQFGINGEHTYSASGAFQIVVHVAVHASVGTVSQNIESAGQVSNPPPVVIDPWPIFPFPPSTYFSGNNFSEIAGMNAPYGIDVAGTNRALTNIMIDWGDGSAPTPGQLQINGMALNSAADIVLLPQLIPFAGYSIVGNHAYATPGSYNVTITADDPPPQLIFFPFDSSPTATSVTTHATATVVQNSVDGGNFAGTPNVPLPFLGGSTALGPDRASATIDWGDGTTSPGTLVPNGTDSFGHTMYAVAGSHAYAQDGNYRITSTIYLSPQPISDGLSVKSYSTALMTTPIVQSKQPLQLTAAGNAVQLNATLDYTDVPMITKQVNPDVREIFFMNDPNIHYVATIDWGDGTTSNAAVIQPVPYNTFITADPGMITNFSVVGSILPITQITFPNPTVQLSGSHSYATAGNYNVTVTVTAIYAPASDSPIASSETLTGQVAVPGDDGGNA